MKGVQLVYDLATFKRPSQINPEDIEEIQKQAPQSQTVLNLDGNVPDTPGTPAMSAFAIDDEFNLPISVAIFILLGYIFIGATLFCLSEGWGFFESFYFVFISMSTIGFGDYVPKVKILRIFFFFLFLLRRYFSRRFYILHHAPLVSPSLNDEIDSVVARLIPRDTFDGTVNFSLNSKLDTQRLVISCERIFRIL